MAIIDERRIAFDCGALKEVLGVSRQAARKLGLPDSPLSKVVLNSMTGSATLHFAGALVTVEREKLGALLISYCLRSGIRIPRAGQRSVCVEDTSVILIFQENYMTIPVPKSALPDPARPRSMGWGQDSTHAR
jgi:hypothetical protein